MNSIEKAKDVVKRLEAELVKATDRETALQTERRKISFRAHSGDAEAGTALDKATAASTTASLEIQNISFAISEAKDRVAEAEREERERARKGKAAIARAGEHGAKAAPAFREFCDHLLAYGEAVRELRVLGAPTARDELMNLAFWRALAPSLRATQMLQIDMIPPGLRPELGSLFENYLVSSRRWAAAVLGEASDETSTVDAVEAA